MLEAWLDFQRATLLVKCAGLTDDQLRLRACPPSTLSLLGLVRHMNEVEQAWFGRFVGDDAKVYDRPDADFEDVDGADVAADLAAYRAQVARSQERVAGHGLDETFTGFRGRPVSLRWLVIHLIQEYARHNGHADLIRERIDGATGF
jgi:uncharacterized damage-inducible protein DinB